MVDLPAPVGPTIATFVQLRHQCPNVLSENGQGYMKKDTLSKEIAPFNSSELIFRSA